MELGDLHKAQHLWSFPENHGDSKSTTAKGGTSSARQSLLQKASLAALAVMLWPPVAFQTGCIMLDPSTGKEEGLVHKQAMAP